MNKERKRMRFEILLERYFSNFHRILLVNLIFAIPSAAVFFAVYSLNSLFFSEHNILFYLLSVIIVYPFFSGVITVVRNIARGDENVNVFSVYFDSFKRNFPAFFLHGVLLYIACVISYLSVSLYISALGVSWIFYVLLFICLVIVVFVFFASFYVPLMTVTFDIKLRYIYKNSFLMAFGEFKNNMFALFALAIILALCFTATVFCSTVTALIIVIASLWILFVPATCAYSVVFFVYNGMYNTITNKDKRMKEIDEKIADPKGQLHAETFEDDFSDIDLSLLTKPDEYIYHNGKMVKQSVIISMLKEKNGDD